MNDALAATQRIVDLTGSDTPDVMRGVRLPVGWIAGWTGFVFVMAGIVSTQKGIPFRYAVMSEGINYYTLAIISSVTWFVSARLATRPWGRVRYVAAQFGMGVLLIGIWQLAHAGYLRYMVGPRVWDYVYRGSWMFQLFNAVVLYGAVLGVMLAIQASRRAREHERRQHALELLARDAELRALNAQIEPHFLLNTLNSVLALLPVSPTDARRMLERLADLLKARFDEMQEPDVALGRELDLIDAYLGIERVRFADRLSVAIEVPESLRDLRVPPFLLQPLVENAVKHAVAPFNRPGSVVIRARREQDLVRIEIRDSGPGFERPDVHGRGHGLSLAERRLHAFAPSGELRVERADGGCSVVLTLPA